MRFAGIAAMAAALQLANTAGAQPIDALLIPYASTADDARLPDGRTLHLVCMGQGSPTIIFTAGGNSWSGEWSRVQPGVAKVTRTCAWDRPGFGLSDGTATRPTVATNTSDLEAALKAARIAGPYILVGQSLGAYETLLFADRNKARVAGMVLVDPSVPGQTAIAARLRARFNYREPAPAAGAPMPPPWHEMWRACAGEVRSGALRAGGPDPHGCLAMLGPPTPPAVARAVGAKLTASPRQFETMAAFSADGLEEGQAIVVNPARNYGAMPLTVLTATELPPGDLGPQRAFWEATIAASGEAHDALAALSSRGVNRTLRGAGHNMHLEQPQLVIDAILDVVAQARNRTLP